jgi:hypothetical protein
MGATAQASAPNLLRTTMTTRLTCATLLVLMAIVTASPLTAQAGRVEGKWDLSADTPHGKLALELDLEQKGEAVSGTLLNFRSQKQPVKGTFKNQRLTIETTSGDEIALTGTLAADGKLSGQLSTAMGDVNWTGTRGKKAQ